MQIKGYIGTSLVDYPGNIASVVFTGGCNFRCPFCYNVDLVLHPNDIPDIAEDEIFNSLKERRGFIDGLVITGGEPTLQKDLPDFIRQVKDLGLVVKLDTNGSHPRMLERILRERLVDFVAMDYKAPLGQYDELTGVDVDVEAIRLSAELLKSSYVDYEFRTTIHPSLIHPDDILQIAREIRGAKAYIVQPFYLTNCLDPTLCIPPDGFVTEFEEALQSVQSYFGRVQIRGTQA